MKYTQTLINWKIMAKLGLAILLIQLVMFAFSGTIIQVQASPATYADSVWEYNPGNGAKNDILANAYPFVSESITNNPNTPLNVSTWAPDYYEINVYPGFYFQVFIEFNPDIVYDNTGLPIDTITTYPGFQADIDIELYAQNTSLLEKSTGWGSSEAIGPIKTTANERYYINVSAANPMLGFESVAYSTIYNMSIIFDDVWELLDTNDQISDLSDPYAPGGSDDELLPGVYSHLRFSTGSGDNLYSEHQDKDVYLMWYYKDTQVTYTVSSFVDPASTTYQGPDLNVYFYDRTNLKSYSDDQGILVETWILDIPETGWYYIELDNSVWDNANYYSLSIEIEDLWEGGGNNDVATAFAIEEGASYGRVVSDGKDDWYKLAVTQEERLTVDLTWFIPPSENLKLNLTVYENESIATSVLDEARPIYNGLRFGSYRAFKTSVFIIHIGSNIADGRYYNLTVNLDDIDDRYEDNDLPTTATLLPTSTKTYAPTEADPWAGLFLLYGDLDFYAIQLLPGDYLEVHLDFNGTLGNIDIKLFDSSLNILDTSELIPSNHEKVHHHVRYADTYLFIVYGVGLFGQLGIDYNMSVIIDSFDDPFEDNEDSTDAAPLAEGYWPDLILRDGDDDWYYVYLHQNDFIEINLTYFVKGNEEEDVNDIDLDLLFSDEYQSLANNSHTLFNETISFIAPNSGKYYILCVIDGNSNAYNLTINIKETDDIYEDNDRYPDATRVTFLTGIPTTSVIHTVTDLYIRVRDDDWFVTNVPAGLAIIVELNFLSSENLNLDLYDMNGTIIDTSHLQTGDTEIVGPFPANSTFAGDFYFRVSMPTGLNTFYTLQIVVGPEELLITRQTVPPHGNFSTSKPYKPGPLEDLIVIAGVGALIGGGAAGAFWVANKTGALSKGTEKVKDLLGRGGTSGGIRKKPPTGGKKPPS